MNPVRQLRDSSKSALSSSCTVPRRHWVEHSVKVLMKGCSAVRLMAFMVSPYYSASARARLFKKMLLFFFTETPPPLQKKPQTNWKVLVQFWQLERSGFILGNKIWLTANFTSFYKSLGLGQRKPGQHKPLLAILFHNYFQITW